MYGYLLMVGAVVLICILMSRWIEKLAVPSLLIFLLLGMCFGEDGLLRIPFDNYAAADSICTVSLIFIMFYGGFGTNVQAAKPVLAKSVLMSTLGVVLTAAGVGAAAHLLLKLPWTESLLIGSVIASTDAASVFNILRSRRLSLKEHTASLLEVESGSNDPVSYMMTATCIAVLAGDPVSVPRMIAEQLLAGILCGILAAKAAVFVMRRLTTLAEHQRTILVFSVALIAYALPSVLGGNGYLSVYICGIIMGNSWMPQKRFLVHFFDVVTGVAQVLIFFLLGLLVTPSELPAVFVPALLITVVMTLVVRPAVSAAVLLPFGSGKGQIAVVAWAGLRGAASIVFAILAVLSGIQLKYDLFNLVFCIVLLSISIQGTLLPAVCRRLHMIDKSWDVSRTFNDYQEESDVTFVKVHIDGGHSWKEKLLKEAEIPRDILVVLIERRGETIIPDGSTRIEEGDLLVLAAKQFEDRENVEIREISVDRGHKWRDKCLGEIHPREKQLIILIKRKGKTLIPDGQTVIREGDILVSAQPGA